MAVLEKMTMTLNPEEDITKILLSTPSYLVGKYEEDNFLLSIAFDRNSRYDSPDQEYSHDREYFILVVKTPPNDRSHVAIPDYTAAGDLLCIFLSILYGKRFDNHGLVESIGKFWLPNYPAFGNYHLILPFNSRKPRPDLEIPLSLHEIRRIAPMLHEGSLDPHFEDVLMSAGRFYLHALQHAETQPEIAFLDLITCGEILSYFFPYDQDDLLDDKMKRDLIRIEEEIDGGGAIVRSIRDRLFSVKRRFVKTILYLLNPYFFQQSEAKENYDRLNQVDISIRIKAAYDLRSRYVHTGVDFGLWIKPLRDFNSEIQMGEPVIGDSELKKILVRSPTLIGMERIMRFCLLRFMHLNGVFIDLKLEGEGLRMSEEATTLRSN
jgi:hypothetical protein